MEPPFTMKVKRALIFCLLVLILFVAGGCKGNSGRRVVKAVTPFIDDAVRAGDRIFSDD